MVSYATLGLNFVISLILGAIVLHIAAILAKVDDATIMKALTVAVIAAIIGLILGVIAPGALWAGLLGLIITIVLIKYFYATTWTKAVIVWVIYFVLMLVILTILGMIGVAVWYAAT